MKYLGFIDFTVVMEMLFNENCWWNKGGVVLVL